MWRRKPTASAASYLKKFRPGRSLRDDRSLDSGAEAARDANLLDRLTIITTDLFPDLVPHIRSGAVAATIYQRPRAQGQMAFRMLHEFLAEGRESLPSGCAGSAFGDARKSRFLSATANRRNFGKGKTAEQPRERQR